MKILHLINESGLHKGGAQKIIHQLVRGGQGHSVFSLQDRCGRITRLSTLKASLVLFASIILRRDTLFVAHHRFFIPFLWFAKRRVFVCHNIFENKNFILRALFSTPVVAVSNAAADYVRSHHKSGSVIVIENGVDFSADEVRVRSHSGCFRMFYVGRLADQKGITLLLEAAKVLHTRLHQTYSLAIVGDGELMGWSKDYCEENDLGGIVTFHGYQEAPFKVAVNADLIVIPSRYEGFGLVAYEALVRGHQVLLSNIPAFQPLNVCEGVNFFEMGTPEELAHSIKAIIERGSGAVTSSTARAGSIRRDTEMVKDYQDFFKGLVEGVKC